MFIGRSSFFVALLLILAPAVLLSQPAPSFDASKLRQTGDNLRYGSYNVIRIGDGIFQINDPGDPRAKLGGLGVDVYMIVGKSKALVIDLGNNYIDGYAKDDIPPRPNAAAELLAVIDALAGKLPVEVAITHAHPDHDGMTQAFSGRKTILWMPKGEVLEATRQHHKADPSVYTIFDHATKSFDLGGGRIVKPLLVRGHTDGCTVYLLASDAMLFTGDAVGFGVGLSLPTAERLHLWSQEMNRLVSYLRATLSPAQRYSLKVFTGHSVPNAVAGFVSANHGRLDLSYLDWRFLQDQALCAAAILKGQWLIPDSGLRLQSYVNPKSGHQGAVMLYGIGAVVIPEEEAYRAAGIRKLD